MLIFNDVSYENGITGIACVAYDNSGELLTVRMKTQLADDVVTAELMALQEGAAIGTEISKGSPTILVSDNLIAVKLINRKSNVPPVYVSLVSNIQNILGTSKVCWKSRTENSLADALAVFALRRTTEKDKNEPGVIFFGV